MLLLVSSWDTEDALGKGASKVERAKGFINLFCLPMLLLLYGKSRPAEGLC